MNNDLTVMCKPYAWKVLGILLYPIGDTHVLRKAVEKARAELLNQDESIKDRCIEKVHVFYIMSSGEQYSR